MAISLVAVADKITATLMNTVINAVNGFAPIAAGTISGTSVTVSGLAAKLAQYNEIVIRLGKYTGAGDFVVQLYQSGAALTTGYNVNAVLSNGSAVTPVSAYGGSGSWILGAGSTMEVVTITLRGAGKSTSKFGHVESASQSYIFNATISNTNTSPCDGFVISIGGASFTGDYTITGTA